PLAKETVRNGQHIRRPHDHWHHLFTTSTKTISFHHSPFINICQKPQAIHHVCVAIDFNEYYCKCCSIIHRCLQYEPALQSGDEGGQQEDGRAEPALQSGDEGEDRGAEPVLQSGDEGVQQEGATQEDRGGSLQGVQGGTRGQEQGSQGVAYA
ncbi:hypothetical protein V8E54_014164, partial [Elaphomyces granulatus]